MGYMSDFLVYSIKKRVFSFEVALTRNELTDCYKILGEENYAFFLLACKIGSVEAEI